MKRHPKQLSLTKEEREIITAYESGHLKTVPNFEKEKARLEAIARFTMKKNRSINIRLTERDLQKVKAKAAEKGLPYQTFIGSLLHQYSSGKIKEIECNNQ